MRRQVQVRCECVSGFWYGVITNAPVRCPLAACLICTQAFDHPSIDSIATFLAESDLVPPVLLTPIAPTQPTASAPAATAHHTFNTAKSLTAPAPSQSPNDILIVASAFKEPGKSSPTRLFLWQHAAATAANTDGSSVVPLSRWDVDLALPSHMPGELQARFGCFLDGIEAFDPEVVGMTPAEALLVDPQQRLVMEAFGDVAAMTSAAGVYSR